MKLYNFLYDVNLFEINKYFKFEETPDSPYYLYKSKDFYGATIRTDLPLEAYVGRRVLLAVRYKGHGYSNGEFDRLTGVKMDVIGPQEPRMRELDIALDSLPVVSMRIETKNGLITINEVNTACLILSLHDEKEHKTGIITFIPEKK